MSPKPTPEHFPTNDRIIDFLLERGWKPPAEDRNYWLGPDGEPTHNIYPASSERNYQLLLDMVAATEERGQLNIALELEGHPRIDTDLRAIDHTLATWALLRRNPGALARITDEPSTMYSITAVPPAERGPLLAELRNQLEQVTAMLLHPVPPEPTPTHRTAPVEPTAAAFPTGAPTPPDTTPTETEPATASEPERLP